MNSDQPPAGAPGGGRGRRRQRTIDLTATEIGGGASDPQADARANADDPDSMMPADAATEPSRPAAGPSAASGQEAAAPAAGIETPAAEVSAGTMRPDQAVDPLSRRRPTVPWPMIAAGAAGGIAAAIVLGLGTLLLDREARERPREARLASMEQQLRELGARPLPAGEAGTLNDLAGRIATLEGAVVAPRAAAASDPAVVNRISTVEGGVKVLGETVSSLGRRSDEIAVAVGEARQRADVSATALAELAQKLSRPGASAIERSELETLAGRVAAVERAERSVEAELAKPRTSEDRAVRLVVAASALAAAVERGAPFVAQLRTVKALASPDPSPLPALDAFASTGVPTAAVLARELAALVPSLNAAAGAPAREGGILEKLQAGAERLVRIRPLDEVAGSDAAAMVARIEIKAARADLPGALAELAQLPASVRAPAEPWIERAQARAAAIEASRRLAADTLAGLGK